MYLINTAKQRTVSRMNRELDKQCVALCFTCIMSVDYYCYDFKLIYIKETTFKTAFKTRIKIYLFALSFMFYHQKTVTSLCIDYRYTKYNCVASSLTNYSTKKNIIHVCDG